MAVEADLANANAEDLIVVMGIIGCKDDDLRGDLQKLEAHKLEDIIKLGEAFERKTLAEKGFTVKVKAVQTASNTGAQPKVKRTVDPVRHKEIECPKKKANITGGEKAIQRINAHKKGAC